MQKGAPSTAKEAPFSGRGRRGSAKGGRLKRGARLTPGEFAVLRSLNDCFAMIADGVRTLGAPTWTQRWRRLRFVALLVFVLPPLALLTHLCLALDHLLFPGFKKVKIEKPIFIVGNLRTGSTFLHRLVDHRALRGSDGGHPGCGLRGLPAVGPDHEPPAGPHRRRPGQAELSRRARLQRRRPSRHPIRTL